MRESHRTVIQREQVGTNVLELLDLLFQQPLVNANLVQHRLGIAYNTANRLLNQFEKLGLVNEITGERRNRRYAYAPYIALFEDPKPYADESYPLQITDSDEEYEYSRS